MIIDGLSGSDELAVSGIVYDIIIATGDIFALLVAISILVFLSQEIILSNPQV